MIDDKMYIALDKYLENMRDSMCKMLVKHNRLIIVANNIATIDREFFETLDNISETNPSDFRQMVIDAINKKNENYGDLRDVINEIRSIMIEINDNSIQAIDEQLAYIDETR